MGEIEVRVFGPDPPCARCRSALAVAEKVAARRPGVRVIHVDAMSQEGQSYGFWMTPAIAIGRRVVFEGKVPSEKELDKVIAEELGEESKG